MRPEIGHHSAESCNCFFVVAATVVWPEKVISEPIDDLIVPVYFMSGAPVRSHKEYYF